MAQNRLITRIKLKILFIKQQLIILYYNTITRFFAHCKLKSKILKNTLNVDFISFNSTIDRSLEIKQEDLLIENIILTCYFSKKADPQSGIIRSKADIKYIEPWYNSIISNDLKGIIIHDGLNNEFIEKYQNQNVQFRKYEAGHYSIFEERWMAYFLFLSRTNIKNAFITDANDVIITSSPFKIIKNPYTLFIGRDQANKIGLSGWMMEELNNFIKDSKYKINKTYYFQQVYNAGVVGGSKPLLLFFICEVIKLILLTNTNSHKDMNLLNIVIHKHFFPKLKIRPYEKSITEIKNDTNINHKFLVSGYPLNSEFNKFEHHSKALFIHK